jgi:hypothetical protein
MTFYVFGTLQHNEKTFGHGEEITASDVDGKENLQVLLDTGAVVKTDPIPKGEFVLPPGETINSLGVDPRPGPGGVTMATTPSTPTNVPADIRSGMIGAPGGETKSTGAPDLQKSQAKLNQALEVDLEKTQENPLGGQAAKAAAESAEASAAPTGVATSKDQGESGKSSNPSVKK